MMIRKIFEKNILGGENLKSQSGQAGVIVLLISVVMVTVGLSIANRSVTDVRLSLQEEETTRAFDAAEAGVEDALRKDLSALVGTPQTIDVGGVPATYMVSGENQMDVELMEGETVEVRLDGLVAGDELGIWWGSSDENCISGDLLETAAIVVSIFNVSNNNIRRMPFDSCGRSNNFSVADDVHLGGSGYYSKIEASDNAFVRLLDNSEDLMRIRVVYGPLPTERETRVHVEGTTTPLPEQYYRITSEASTPGRETRAVEVTRTIPGPQSIFDFAVFTGGSLSK